MVTSCFKVWLIVLTNIGCSHWSKLILVNRCWCPIQCHVMKFYYIPPHSRECLIKIFNWEFQGHNMDTAIVRKSEQIRKTTVNFSVCMNVYSSFFHCWPSAYSIYWIFVVYLLGYSHTRIAAVLLIWEWIAQMSHFHFPFAESFFFQQDHNVVTSYQLENLTVSPQLLLVYLFLVCFV